MRSITTTIADNIGKRMSSRHLNMIEEGVSITEFNRMMDKVRSSGVNLNQVSATKLMFYLYNSMPKHDFQMLAQKIEDIDPKDMKRMKAPVACGYDDDGYDYGCGRPARRPSRRSYGCGSDDDDYRC